MSASKGWKTIRLGDAAKCITGNTPSKKEKANYGTYLPLIKPTQLTDGFITEASEYLSEQGTKFARVLPPNSVLVSCIGNLGKTGINSVPVASNQQINAAIFNDGIEPKYGFYFMQSLFARRQLEELSSATTIQIVNKTKFESVLVPLPETLDEQRRIVAEIEKQFTRLDAGVAGLKRVQANLKRYRTAVLKAACEGKLVPTEAELAKGRDASPQASAPSHRSGQAAGSASQPYPFESGEQLLERILIERRKKWLESNQKSKTKNRKYPEPAAPDTADLPDLPDGWAWASLDQISWTSSYGTSAKCSPDNSGPPVLRIPNIAGGKIDLCDMKYAGSGEIIDSGNEVMLGDLLIIRTNGSKNLIGRSAVVQTELSRVTSYASYLIRFRLVGVPMLFAWVGAVWDVSFLRAWIERRAATSAGQHNISMSVLSSMPIPLPPLAEQKRIVEEVERRLSVIDEMETAVIANLKRAARLRQSILKKAFEGELVR